MANYDFSTLNSSDLEELVCDLLNLNEPHNSKVRYKTFKDGKDKGIDFLYSTAKHEYEHVGQVKHFYRTGYSGMLTVLKNDEVEKVKKLKPNKYIFCTSVDLSFSNTEEIKQTFSPYVRTLQDVYGKKDLNRLIEEHEEILDRHYKLWLNDLSILKKILNSTLEFRSYSFIDSELKKRISLYVKTSLFDKAKDALKKNKFIVIAGDPGVGKTTLAEMLIYEYLGKGYKLTYIIDDIKEAETVLMLRDENHIIYFDDFLGSNKVEINRAKGSETALTSIIKRVKQMDNALLVFTTRTHLLTSAVSESEKLRRINLKEDANIFKLEEYDEDVKKQLLNNHIENSELPTELKKILYSPPVQTFIINHPNFSPRSIEFITTARNIAMYDAKAFANFIYSSFDFPDQIWHHAYTEQITENERLLLNTLLSFGDSADTSELEDAFLNRFEFEIKNNNRSKEMHIFRNVLRRLDGGFILVRANGQVQLINPSLTDFLVSYVAKDKDEVKRIAECVKYVSQLTTRLFDLSKGKGGPQMPLSLQSRILEDYHSFVSKANGEADLIRLAIVASKFIDPSKKPEDLIYDILDKITDWEALRDDYDLNILFKEFIAEVKDNPRISQILGDKVEEIVVELITGVNEVKDVVETLEELSSAFDIDFDKFDASKIIGHLDDVFHQYVDEEVEWLKEWITDQGEAWEKSKEIENLLIRVNDTGLQYSFNLTELKDTDWLEIAWHNEYKRLMEKDD